MSVAGVGATLTGVDGRSVAATATCVKINKKPTLARNFLSIVPLYLFAVDVPAGGPSIRRVDIP